MVGFFLRELIKARVGSEAAYEASDPHMRLVQHLWHTIQAHRVITKFREAYFHWRAYMSPSVANHLFKHSVEISM